MLSKPTEQQLEEARKKPVYKVVRVEGNRLKSLWVTGTEKHPTHISNVGEAIALTYELGMVVSDGRYGIWCCTSLRAAKGQAHGNGCGRLCGIYKARPLGKPVRPPSGWGDFGTVLYPAIIMGELVTTLDLIRRS